MDNTVPPALRVELQSACGWSTIVWCEKYTISQFDVVDEFNLKFGALLLAIQKTPQALPILCLIR